MGGIGTAIDVPLGHKDAAYVRSHFDGMEVRVADAPRHGEIVVAVAVTDSGRPLPRIGGLPTAEVKGEDGRRGVKKNGRASGRDRVWQYVEDKGGGEHYK